MGMGEITRFLWVGLLCLASVSAYAGADIQVDKNADNIRPGSGDTVEYTITVSNQGDSNATSVQVTDQLPAGVSYISNDEPTGNYNPITGIWDVGTVGAGEQKILKIIVLVG